MFTDTSNGDTSNDTDVAFTLPVILMSSSLLMHIITWVIMIVIMKICSSDVGGKVKVSNITPLQVVKTIELDVPKKQE